MELDPNVIAPSQDFLKPQTIAFILKSIHENRREELPPDPIIRLDEQGNYIAIDGHNLIAVKVALGENVQVHLATSASDGLPDTSDQNRSRNEDLINKWDNCLEERARVAAEGITTFKELVNKYHELFEMR